jgi:hypothetical protein
MLVCFPTATPSPQPLPSSVCLYAPSDTRLSRLPFNVRLPRGNTWRRVSMTPRARSDERTFYLIQRPKAQTVWERPRESPSSRTSGRHSLTRETPTNPFLPEKLGTPFSIERRSHLLRIRRTSCKNVPPFETLHYALLVWVAHWQELVKTHGSANFRRGENHPVSHVEPSGQSGSNAFQ